MSYEYQGGMGQTKVAGKGPFVIVPGFARMARAFQSQLPTQENEQEPPPVTEETGPSGLTVAIVAGLGLLLVGGGSFLAYKIIKGKKAKAQQPA